MARAMLLALTCAAAAAATAAGYADYSGIKMPAYGGGGDYEAPRDAAAPQNSDDYHGHSPDAPGSLDYKYEEEPRIKTEKPTKDSDDRQVWRKLGRKQRGLMRTMDSGNIDAVNKYDRDEEDVPKFRSSHRYPKHRSRIKDDVVPKDEESLSRRPIKYNRDRRDDVSDIDRKDYFHVHKDDFQDDKSKEFEDDVKSINEATTRRVNRRKPRDRQNLRRKIGADLDEYIDDQEVERRLKSDSDKLDQEQPPSPRRTRPTDTRTHERYRPILDEEEEDPNKVQPINKLKQKTYEDYDDYYDMKRVYSIKSKLPTLLRRTTVRETQPTPTDLLEMLWTPRRMAASKSSEKLWTHRRMAASMSPESSEPTPEPPTRRTTTTSTTTRTTSKTTTTAKTTTTKVTTKLTTTVNNTRLNASELSLAEKSRLSIMKKDQRKEGQHIEPPSKKPPVLLQVTRNVPTVVMVEPPSSMMPWMRARELSEDSPERLDKVKKLMRRKLVAEAKSIHDLTDKWDDMVCDYIDVALLDSHTTALRPYWCLFILCLTCEFWTSLY